MQRHLDMEFGAAELPLDDELVQDAQLAGWSIYRESFDEDGSWCRRTTGTPEGAFPLSGSKYTALCVVYDSKWEIGPEPESHGVRSGVRRNTSCELCDRLDCPYTGRQDVTACGDYRPGGIR